MQKIKRKNIKKGEREKSSQKIIPIGIKIISIYFIINSIFIIILGLQLIFPDKVPLSYTNEIKNQIALLEDYSSKILGLFFILFGILFTIIAIGLWRGKNWARITEIIISCVGIILLLLNFKLLILNIIELLIYVIIVSYLLFDKAVKKAFS